MAGFLAFLFLGLLASLVVGLIKPSVFTRLFRKVPTRKQIGLTFGISTVATFIIFGIVVPPVEDKPKDNSQQVQQQQQVSADKVEEDAINEETNNEEIPTTTDQVVVDNSIQTPETKTETAQSAPVAAPATKPAVQSETKTETTKPTYTYYSISSVVDGDTVKVNIAGTVTTLRLIGMDTPETVDPRKPVQCFGKEASNKAKELLIGKKVRIEKDSSQGELDKYGRTLAYIYREDGLFYNKYMIEQGYAHEYTYSTPYKYQAEFKAAQKSAQTNLRGLWSPDTCNGDTTQAVTTPTANTNTSNTTNTNTSPTVTNSGIKYYTSSHSSSKYYYPETCSGWKSLSATYLKSFDSLAALLAAYPSRTLNPQCQ